MNVRIYKDAKAIGTAAAALFAAQVLTIVFGMGTGVSPNRIGTRNVSA